MKYGAVKLLWVLAWLLKELLVPIAFLPFSAVVQVFRAKIVTVNTESSFEHHLNENEGFKN